MNYSLKPISFENIHILKNLFQLYVYDISKELIWDVNNDGIFESYSLNDWILNENNFGYYIYVNSNLAGFVMVDKDFKIITENEESYNLSEIFILNRYKNNGLATSVIREIFDSYHGNWEVRPVPKSISAFIFWESFFKDCDFEVSKQEWKDNRYAFIFSNN